MIIIFPPLILGVIGVCLWLARRPSRHWVRTALVSIIYLAGCFGCTQLGIRIGKVITTSNFTSAQRTFGSVFTEIKEEISSGDIQKTKVKISFIEEKWWSINFFDTDTSGGRIPLSIFMSDYYKINTTNQSPGPTPASHSSHQP